jgi:GNAT superfamily N-acetyltransferase
MASQDFANSVPNAWSIRACRPGEAPALLSLWRHAGATPSLTDTLEDIERVLAKGTALVAEADGKLIGSIIGVFDGWRANIYRLAVLPAFRRRGIARALLAEVEKWLLQQGAKRLAAIVELDHPWAMGFWEAVGCMQSGNTRRYTRNFARANASTQR